MPENSGNLLPIYVVADESASMDEHIDDLNDGLARLHEALLAEPMAAAKVRFSILGFSDDVQVRLQLADLRRETALPRLTCRNMTVYARVFEDLRARIPDDVSALKGQGYRVHRPAVFVLTDGQPTDGDAWLAQRDQLVDRQVTPAAPNIIAFGIGNAQPATILRVATQQDYAFVAMSEVDISAAIAKFCSALTKSIVHSGRTLGSAQPSLVVERPQNFTMAIDVV
ncbi:VWA domain-containing protein [Actinoplanes sp. NPDC024001]|uniref:vWA domain-containing protein n=1 Tax=Actinoplanes sp. NPDC024001 TaxID=3154598 RepID=UPI00340D162E